jgi:hypothetical protein
VGAAGLDHPLGDAEVRIGLGKAIDSHLKAGLLLEHLLPGDHKGPGGLEARVGIGLWLGLAHRR